MPTPVTSGGFNDPFDVMIGGVDDLRQMSATCTDPNTLKHHLQKLVQVISNAELDGVDPVVINHAARSFQKRLICRIKVNRAATSSAWPVVRQAVENAAFDGVKSDDYSSTWTASHSLTELIDVGGYAQVRAPLMVWLTTPGVPAPKPRCPHCMAVGYANPPGWTCGKHGPFWVPRDLIHFPPGVKVAPSMGDPDIVTKQLQALNESLKQAGGTADHAAALSDAMQGAISEAMAGIDPEKLPERPEGGKPPRWRPMKVSIDEWGKLTTVLDDLNDDEDDGEFDDGDYGPDSTGIEIPQPDKVSLDGWADDTGQPVERQRKRAAKPKDEPGPRIGGKPKRMITL